MDDMTNPSNIKKYASRYDFFMKKNLGQNFLTDANIAQKIVDAAVLTKDDTAVEIGPGAGAITQYLIERAGKVYAIEIDPFACKILSDVFEESDNFTLINKDILKCDIPNLLQGAKGRLTAISNLPYYITSPILMKLLTCGVHFESIVVMLQKEASARLGGKVGTKDYSSFTIAVDYYAETEPLFNVPKSVFMPMPNVDSAVIKLTPRKSPKVKVADERLFFDVVRAGFATRRKTLTNCLTAALSINKDAISEILEDIGINQNERGERLSIEQFALLSDKIYSIIDKKVLD